jgi:hypothetical protein
MVIGSSLTAFAGDNDGSSTGAGTSEGHVEKKATNVVLPTIASDATPFAYTMDPEGLIKATSHEKYGSAVEFPADDKDTQVYFNNGKKGGEEADKDNVVYANSSVAQKVTNKSSHKINLTVKAEVAEAKTTDIPLVAKSALADASAASLYLGLVVGSGDNSTKEITADAAASKTVEIAGTPGNFKIAVKTTGEGDDAVKTYEYRALTLDEWKASADANADKDMAAYDATWANTTFKLEGAVTTTKAITSTTTAPKIKVTWSWVDPTDTVATAIAYTSKNSAGDVTLTFTPGTDAKTLAKTSFKINGVETAAWSSYATNIIFNNDNTITVKAAVFGFSSITGVTTDNKYTFVVVDTDGTSYTTGEVTIQ